MGAGHTALAQVDLPTDVFGVSHAKNVTADTDSMTITFEGIVLAPGGVPAEGAVVVSSAGGQAVTDGSGAFALDAHVSVGASSVQVTAVHPSVSNLVASRRVELAAAAGRVPLGSLQLSGSSTCNPSWLPTFGPEPGIDGSVESLAVFDDGGGPALYAGGSFTAAGPATANRIAKWDGGAWVPLGSGMDGRVLALAVFDDGTGPALYAGGGFSNAGGVAAPGIAKWDGSSWAALTWAPYSGSNSSVCALAVFDDGTGPALYAGGGFVFSYPGMTFVSDRIARWNGLNWTRLGGGLDASSGSRVRALTVFDDGGGDALYAGGSFATADGAAASRVAKWDGSNWAALGSGVDSDVYALEVFDDGGGPALYAGGLFARAGGVGASRIARWDGAGWSAVGGGIGGLVRALKVFDDGSGPALYAAGAIGSAGGVPADGAAKWDGSSWTPLGAGVHSSFALAVYDDGSGAELCVGGNFFDAGSVTANNIARWNGSTWRPFGGGLDQAVLDLAVFDDGSGPALYATGMKTASELAVDGIAKWDGSNWSSIGGLFGYGGYVMEVFDDGTGPALVVGGTFDRAGNLLVRNIAKWDGASWSPLGSGVGGTGLQFGQGVFALEIFDDGGGPALYAGGRFGQAGSMPANSIARWNGSSWSPLGSGVLGSVLALQVFDDGSGPALFVGGQFAVAGSVLATNIAKWDGSSWSVLGHLNHGGVGALTVFDDGGGLALYAAGGFRAAAATPIARIAKWTGGTSWAPLGAGISSSGLSHISALAAFDDGQGSALYAAGLFAFAGSVSAKNIAKWDGSAWTALDGGVNNGPHYTDVNALEVFDDGGGDALYAGGSFLSSSGDAYVAKWGCALAHIRTYCAGKTNSVGCLPFLTTVGSPSTSGTGAFSIIGNDVVPIESGFLTYGFKKSNLDFHGAKLCVKLPFVRTSVTQPNNTGGGCSGWVLHRNFNTTIQSGIDPALDRRPRRDRAVPSARPVRPRRVRRRFDQRSALHDRPLMKKPG